MGDCEEVEIGVLCNPCAREWDNGVLDLLDALVCVGNDRELEVWEL